MNGRIIVIIIVVLLAVGAAGLFFSESNEGKTTTPSQNGDDVTTLVGNTAESFCDGLLAGELNDGWVVEENVTKRVGLSQQKCEFHATSSDFEISVSEATGSEEEMKDIEHVIQLGGVIVEDRNEELRLADGNQLSVFSSTSPQNQEAGSVL